MLALAPIMRIYVLLIMQQLIHSLINGHSRGVLWINGSIDIMLLIWLILIFILIIWFVSFMGYHVVSINMTIPINNTTHKNVAPYSLILYSSFTFYLYYYFYFIIVFLFSHKSKNPNTIIPANPFFKILPSRKFFMRTHSKRY